MRPGAATRECGAASASRISHKTSLRRSSGCEKGDSEDLLGRGIVGLDIAVDEDGQVVGGGVDLVLLLGDVQLSHQLVEHLDGALVLLGRHG